MADSQILELPANTANELPVTPDNQTFPPVQDTPIVHKTATQTHEIDSMVTPSDEIYKIIGVETKGHYLVGISPKEFLDNFLPLDPKTPAHYTSKTPSTERLMSLQSVPPQQNQNETHMYAPFVEALDGWVTGIDNQETLRFARCSKLDTMCANMNVDVATYWNPDYPITKIGDGLEVLGPCTFSLQQTHEEFKRDHTYDAFVHKSDDGPRVTRNVPDQASALSHGVNPKTEAQDDAEVETDTVAGISTRGQIAAYAGTALSMAFRTHFFSLLILGQYARMIRWDRRGAIVTSRFDYTQKPELIFDFYHRYGQLTLPQRGFDTRAVPLKSGERLPEHVANKFGAFNMGAWHDGAEYRHEIKVASQPPLTDARFFRLSVEDRTQKITETFFIPAPIFRTAYLSPFCRASRRCLAYLDHPTESKMCFLKDSWQEVSTRTAPESDIYRMLHKAKVEHIASMRLGDDVAGLETVTQHWFNKLAHSGRYQKLGAMVCHRIILDTVAHDLSTFTWCKVLLSCLADVVDAIQQAYKAGVLHRDISAGNIMIMRDKKTQQWRGVLIDWDMCLLLKQRTDGQEVRTARTGTWAFISTRLLMPASDSRPIIHSLEDDLESIFWVLLYQVLRFTDHNLNPYKLYKMMKATFSESDTYEGVTTGGLHKLLLLSQCHLRQSHKGIAKFTVPGLNTILDGLGFRFNARYVEAPPTNNAIFDLSHMNTAVPSVSTDFNNPDDKWLSAYLREVADLLGPTGVNRFGLDTSTVNSQQPVDSSVGKRADPSVYPAEYRVMSWAKDENDSIRIKNHDITHVTSSMINHLSGISSGKRPLEDDFGKTSGPAKKKKNFL